MAKMKVNVVVNMKNHDEIPMITEVIPAKTMDAMLKAEADVVEPEILKNARTMIKGPYWKGKTGEALTRKKPVFVPRGANRERQLVLTFTGVRVDEYHRETEKEKDNKNRRNAAIAFINEYGARDTPARPFMSRAVADKEEEAVKAAEAVFDQWREKNT